MIVILKTVLLRVNSLWSGSAFSYEIDIRQEVNLKKGKPVVVSIELLAWLQINWISTADYVCRSNTITGSMGILPNVSWL